MSDHAATPIHYPGLLAEIRQRIQSPQTRAMPGVNAELIRLYWEIGQMLDSRQQSEALCRFVWKLTLSSQHDGRARNRGGSPAAGGSATDA